MSHCSQGRKQSCAAGSEKESTSEEVSCGSDLLITSTFLEDLAPEMLFCLAETAEHQSVSTPPRLSSSSQYGLLTLPYREQVQRERKLEKCEVLKVIFSINFQCCCAHGVI